MHKNNTKTEVFQNATVFQRVSQNWRYVNAQKRIFLSSCKQLDRREGSRIFALLPLFAKTEERESAAWMHRKQLHESIVICKDWIFCRGIEIICYQAYLFCRNM